MTAMPNSSSDRPIIVFGCPRSGTTLSQLILSSHSNIAVAPETRFLMSTYNRRLQFGDLEERKNRLGLARYIVNKEGNRFEDLILDRDAIVEEIVDGPPTVGSALGIVFRAYARRFDAARWGAKFPGYHRHLEAIRRMFPDAHLIHVVRDPRAAIASLKRMPWWKRGTHASVATWAQATEHAREAMRRWPSAVHEIQYERLLADPEGEVRALCSALGEEFDPNMLTPYRVSDAIPARKRWQDNTRKPFTTEALEKWRDELDPWELALCETVLRRGMRRYGYELSGAGLPPVKRLAGYARVYWRMKAIRYRQHRRDRERRSREPNPVAARLTSAQRASEPALQQ